MSRLIVVALRDVAAQVFYAPQTVKHAQQALRGFVEEVNRPAEGNALNSSPQDFELWQIAEYVEADGAFVERRERLARAVDVIREVQ